jgi:hypothetical protein
MISSSPYGSYAERLTWSKSGRHYLNSQHRLRRRGFLSRTIESPPPLPDKPSIAVRPFQNLSDDPEQEYFADGMVEEIITALSRFSFGAVTARRDRANTAAIPTMHP